MTAISCVFKIIGRSSSRSSK